MNWNEAMKMAIQEGRKFDGATSPNPAVGAILLDSHANILSLGAHELAGGAHAEIQAFSKLPRGQNAETLVVSLEPCNHKGRTPPCTQKIIDSGIKRVVIGTRDPNQKVLGGGADFLRKNGIEVIEGVEEKEARLLISGFWVRSTLDRPMFIVKTVWDEKQSMIPPPGQKTFSSSSSIRLAHELRRAADAIVTGVGTVLADDPLFTVRAVEDFKGKTRDLYVMDRQNRMPKAWQERQSSLGFRVKSMHSLEDLVQDCRDAGHLKVLVEAGPRFSSEFLNSQYSDLHVRIQKGEPDKIEQIYGQDFLRIIS